MRSVNDPTWSDKPAREIARSAGLKHYVSEKRCKRDHPLLRYVNSGACVACVRDAHTKVQGGKRQSADAYYSMIVRQFVGIYGQAAARARGLRVPEDSTVAYTCESDPCRRGHTLRYRSSGNCVECTRLANRAPAPATDPLAALPAWARGTL